MKVEIDYTNYRGERSKRIIVPIEIKYGSNVWHKEPQWVLFAEDESRNSIRSFAMKDIHSWVPV